jgi:inhibitor of KinA sporulation pathway (predicted exonuclease)
MIRYICILDFEATCWNDNGNGNGNGNGNKYKSQIEIIEFPSILYKLEKNKLEKIGEFHEYVKPIIHPILSEFCTELTGIKQETVDKADIFPNVFNRHYKWLSSSVPNLEELTFLTCGAWDLKIQLPRELNNKNVKMNKIYSHFINIKDEFEYFYKVKALGMDGMLKYLKMSLDGKHHSGIDDCRNISKILIKMVENGHTDFKINYVN